MKKISLFCLALLASVAAAGQDRIVPMDKAPDIIKTYVAKHFAGKQIAQIVRDDLNQYDVLLDDYSTQLEFERNKIKQVKSRSKLPDSVIPPAILAYVNQHFAGQQILEWEEDDWDDGYRQQVRLSNRMELEFDRNGRFLYVDDIDD